MSLAIERNRLQLPEPEPLVETGPLELVPQLDRRSAMRAAPSADCSRRSGARSRSRHCDPSPPTEISVQPAVASSTWRDTLAASSPRTAHREPEHTGPRVAVLDHRPQDLFAELGADVT